MLRHVSNLIRTKGANGYLRWNEKTFKKAINQWSTVYVADNADPPEESHAVPHNAGATGSSSAPGAAVGDGWKQSVLSESGISFEVPHGRKLAEPVRQTLRKIHCNLGHPSPADLERFLKLGGVRGETLEAVKWM